jgi:hypothetical protein
MNVPVKQQAIEMLSSGKCSFIQIMKHMAMRLQNKIMKTKTCSTYVDYTYFLVLNFIPRSRDNSSKQYRNRRKSVECFQECSLCDSS